MEEWLHHTYTSGCDYVSMAKSEINYILTSSPGQNGRRSADDIFGCIFLNEKFFYFDWTAPSHYLNQCWNIVNWTLRNKLQWKFNRNSDIFIHENAIESVVCEMAAILSRPEYVKKGSKSRIQGNLNSLLFFCHLSPVGVNLLTEMSIISYIHIYAYYSRVINTYNINFR